VCIGEGERRVKIARIAVPDLVSNSYFPAIAAIELGCFTRQGLEVVHELIFPNFRAFEALRDEKIDFVAGPAHAVFHAFPEWRGAKLLAALAQGMYWLLVLRSDLAATPGDVNAVKGRTIGAAPLVNEGLKRMLIESGLDLERDGVRIVGVPGADAPGVSFGVAAAQALADGKLDGFWANAMGAENAVRSGVGKVILDVRRGLGPAFAFHYTMPVLVTSDRAIARDAEMVAAGVRAIVDAQRMLKADVSLATKVGRALFPPAEAALIAAVVARDLPYYDATISENAVAGINRFAKACGLMQGSASYDQVVATQFRHLWTVIPAGSSHAVA
jgi:ABC-type nitrate/sulfonate/bicarbonate transport system substrate-binding protein